MDMTKRGCVELETTGLGFVLSSISVWAQEFEEDMGREAAQYLRALGDIVDPRKSHTQKRAAEKRRRQAFAAMSAHASRPGWMQPIDTEDPQP